MIDPIKRAVRVVMRSLARAINKLSRGKVTPNGVTLFGVAMHIPIALLIAARVNILAAVLLLLFGLFDTLDGELARLQHSESPQGRLLDSVTDRIKEVLLYTGAAYATIASTGKPYLAVWAVAACGCSLLTSYVNAAGDSIMAGQVVKQHAANKAFRVGLFSFEIRMFILLVGLVINEVPAAIIVITIGAAYTAMGRLLHVLRKVAEMNS
jgi:phosphatidylglycerophosphate synthase